MEGNEVMKTKKDKAGAKKAKLTVKKAKLAVKKAKLGKASPEELPLKKGDVFETPDGRKWKYVGNGTAKLVSTIAVLLAFCGCSTSEPASRLTKGEYGDIRPRIEVCIESGASSNSVIITMPLTIGDAAYASADSKGSTETQTANPTNTTDVKPDVDVNTTGGRTAGVLETAVSVGAALLKGDSDKGSAECAGGECSPGACSDCTVK